MSRVLSRVAPKMLVVDLDRTLLRSDGSIALRTLHALQACQDRGMRVAFATGRPLRAARPYWDRFPWDAMIHHNGAVFHAGSELIRTCRIPFALARDLLASLSDALPLENLSIEIDDTLTIKRPTGMDYGFTVDPDFSGIPHHDADKILISCTDPATAAKVRELLPPSLYDEPCDNLILIMRRGCTKQDAVRAAVDHFGLTMSQVIAFGDDVNDIGMLRECGIGVAMGNASDAVKDAADHVCGHHDEDGVAEWMYDYVAHRLRWART